MKFRFLLLIFSVFIFGNISKGAPLEIIAQKILEQGPETISEGFEMGRAYSNLAVAANLPDPEVGGEYLFAPESEDNRWAAEVTWGVEWPGVYGARKKEAKSQVDATEKMIYARRVERLAEIKGLLLDYIRCEKKLSLLEELNANNDSIYKLAEQSHRGGEMTVLDLHKVKLEYANIRGAKAALLDEETGVVQQLSAIYGKDCRVLLASLDCEFPEVILPTEEQIASIGEKAPSVIESRAKEETAAKGMKVAGLEALPSLSVGYKHAYEEMTHFNGAILGVSIPIFSNRGKKKKAEVDYLDSRFQTDRAINEAETEAEISVRRLRQLDSQIKEVATIVDHADYNATLLKAYNGGVITLIEYLTDRNYFTTAAMELVNLQHTAARLQVSLSKYF